MHKSKKSDFAEMQLIFSYKENVNEKPDRVFVQGG